MCSYKNSRLLQLCSDTSDLATGVRCTYVDKIFQNINILFIAGEKSKSRAIKRKHGITVISFSSP